MFDKAFFNIYNLKLDKQFLCIVFSEYGNYCLLFFDINLNILEKNMYANLLTRCDDTCVITPYLFIYLLYFQYFSVVLLIESVVEEILMKKFHTLSPMYGKFFYKVVGLCMGKIK